LTEPPSPGAPVVPDGGVAAVKQKGG